MKLFYVVWFTTMVLAVAVLALFAGAPQEDVWIAVAFLFGAFIGAWVSLVAVAHKIVDDFPGVAPAMAKKWGRR